MMAHNKKKTYHCKINTIHLSSQNLKFRATCLDKILSTYPWDCVACIDGNFFLKVLSSFRDNFEQITIKQFFFFITLGKL